MMKIDTIRSENNRVTHEYVTPNPPHMHYEWELTLFEEGVARNVVNGVSYDVSRGDVFLMGPQDLHAIEFVTRPHVHRDVYISDADMRLICDSLSPDFYRKNHKGGTPAPTSRAPRMLETVSAELKDLETAIRLTDVGENNSERRCKSIANGIVHFLLSLYLKEEWRKEDTVPRWLYDIVHELQKPENFPKRINEIIKMSNYSHAQFSKIFKQHTGLSLIDYVVNVRLDYAAHLLKTSDLSSLSISSAIGYDSFSFFIKIFKKRYGVTPCEIQKSFCGKRKTPNVNKKTPPCFAAAKFKKSTARPKSAAPFLF